MPRTPLMTLVTLYLLAFAMKAAAFPVNFWLPASYHTPRIVVSALFAGLLTKVGVYALLRVLVTIMPMQRDIIAERLDVKRSEVVPTASFIDDLNADSLDIVELVMGIEKDFDIEIPDDEAEKIRTVQDAVDYIVAHVS